MQKRGLLSYISPDKEITKSNCPRNCALRRRTCEGGLVNLKTERAASCCRARNLFYCALISVVQTLNLKHLPVRYERLVTDAFPVRKRLPARERDSLQLEKSSSNRCCLLR